MKPWSRVSSTVPTKPDLLYVFTTRRRVVGRRAPRLCPGDVCPYCPSLRLDEHPDDRWYALPVAHQGSAHCRSRGLRALPWTSPRARAILPWHWPGRRGIRGVVGLDIVPQMVQMATGQVQGQAWGLWWGDALSLPFPDNSFCCATSGFGLRNMPDVHAARWGNWRGWCSRAVGL